MERHNQFADKLFGKWEKTRFLKMGMDIGQEGEKAKMIALIPSDGNVSRLKKDVEDDGNRGLCGDWYTLG